MTVISSSIRYRRQYLVSPKAEAAFEGWRSHRLAPGHWLHTHPDCRVIGSAAGDNAVLCVGNVFDASDSLRGPDEIVARLCAAGTFEDIEASSATLGGRWVLLVKLGDEVRLYPDAAALMPVFFTQAGGRIWAGSQPGLLQDALHLSTDTELVTRLNAHGRIPSWPGKISPVRGVTQLSPNHYLSLRDGSTERFWPKKRIEALELDVAAATISSYLRTIIEGAARLAPLQLWLTGGYDSRVLFAVSRPLHTQMHFCVLDNYRNAAYDRRIAARLVRRAGGDIERIRPRKATPQFWETIRVNSCGMSVASMNFTNSADFVPGRLHVLGVAGEVGRCFYYKNGQRPAAVDADSLCALTRFNENPVARTVFQDWLDETSRLDLPKLGIDVLDLFYWEHRLGAWAAVQSLVRSTFRESLEPYNCRALFEAMLGTAVEHRVEPFQLFRRICEVTYPESLDEPFNWTMGSAVMGRLTDVIPWRIRDIADRFMAYRWGIERRP